MSAEDHVYFPLTGAEPSAFVLVRLFEADGARQAEASTGGPHAEGVDYTYPRTGEPHAVLRDARDFAAANGFDLRVRLDGVDWDPELGSLVEAQ